MISWREWNKRKFFFFNDTATTEIYTLSLHDALPIFDGDVGGHVLHKEHLVERQPQDRAVHGAHPVHGPPDRSEEHTSELQSRQYLVCRLLLEKKNITQPDTHTMHQIPHSIIHKIRPS